MASVFNNIAVWGTTVDEYGSSSYTISGGNTSGFAAGNLIYAQQVNKAFRNATIVPYAIAQMMTDVNVGSSFNIGFDVDPANIAAFASSFKTVFNSYIQSAIKVNSASMADAASAFSTARTIRLTGDVTGSATSTGTTGWAFSTTIGTSKVLTRMISDNAVTTAKIADLNVTTAKIADLNVTTAKIASSAITTEKIETSAVRTSQIYDGDVTTAKLRDGAITTAKIADGDVTNNKLQNSKILFTNGFDNTIISSVYVTLGGSVALDKMFGFTSSSVTGMIKYASSTRTFFLEPDVPGETLKIIPNNYTSNNPFITEGTFPYASTVGQSAFAGCSNLSYISLPNVSYILSGAFSNCTSLVTFTFVATTKNILANAFANCTSLMTLSEESASTAEIDLSASVFLNCTNLSRISLRNVKNIGDAAFKGCSKLTNVNFSRAINVGYSAFNGCTKLSSISFPNAEYIGGNAFYTCSYITSVNFSKVKSMGRAPFDSTITIINISNIETIISNQFGSNNITSNITSIDIRNCQSIGSYGLASISKMSTCFIDEVKSIDYAAFTNCYNLSLLTRNANNNLSKLENIGGSAFNCCSKLSKITFGSRINAVPEYCFNSCTILSSFNFNYISNIYREAFAGTAIPSLIGSTRLSYIDVNAFENCSKLSKVSLPGIQTIDNGAFANCTILSNVNIQTCTKLGNSVFANCSLLTNISLPNVTDMGSGPFQKTGITSLNLPKLVTTKKSQFLLNRNLTTLKLAICSYINEDAFYACPLLTYLYLGSTSVVKLYSTTLYGVSAIFDGTLIWDNNVARIYVPTSLVSKYRTADGWSVLYSRNSYIFQGSSSFQ